MQNKCQNTCFTDENTPSARLSTQTRLHMYVQNVPVCTGTTRFEWTHGFFQRFTPHHNTAHTTQTTHHTRHKTQHHTETDRDRQRQTETETEGEEGTEEKTTRQEQREERRVKREKIHFQCGGAWPFFIGVVICLVKPSNVRFLSLLNNVKYESF